MSRVIEIDNDVGAAPPTRQVIVRAGYDCIRAPCGKNGCGKVPGAGHGIHCEEWLYVIRDVDCALSLLVFSGVWPVTVPTAPLSGMTFPRGADISLHCPFPPDDGNGDGESRECELVRGGRCWVHNSSSLGAMKFMEQYFVAAHGKDQKESFWRAMEDWFSAWVTSARRRLN